MQLKKERETGCKEKEREQVERKRAPAKISRREWLDGKNQVSLLVLEQEDSLSHLKRFLLLSRV